MFWLLWLDTTDDGSSGESGAPWQSHQGAPSEPIVSAGVLGQVDATSRTVTDSGAH